MHRPFAVLFRSQISAHSTQSSILSPRPSGTFSRSIYYNSRVLYQVAKDTMTEARPEEYTPPKVWENSENGGKWSKINRPISGATYEEELPVGEHALQLYSLATPNGIKATIMLEELLEAGLNAEYDGWLIKIDGQQFSSGFVTVNPNSKIPALVDRTPLGGSTEPLRVFESGSILVYLGEKYNKFLPPVTEWRQRTEVMSWVMWQMGSAPFVGGGFGHFFAYAPYKMKYPIDRYTMETKRQLDVLDKNLAMNTFMVGDEYTIADMAIWSWYGQLVLGNLYDGSSDFLDVASYKNVIRWAEMIAERPAVKRGIMVNKIWGPLDEQLWNRHSSTDFETQTQDKLTTSGT